MLSRSSLPVVPRTTWQKASWPRLRGIAPAPRALSGWIARFSGAIAIALTLGLGSAGCSAEEASSSDIRTSVDPSSSAPSIFGGDRDGDTSSSVVALRVGTGGTFELCSATVIAPNVVLTARHCVTKNLTTSVSCDENGRSANGKHIASEEEPASLGIYVGATPSFASAPDATARAIVAPAGDVLCNADIALLVLDRELTDITPMAVRLGSTVAEGETIRSVGYGQNDRQIPIGTRFRKENVPVLAMGKAVSASRTPLGKNEFEVGRSICQGDSGGPAISELSGAVVGVVSRGGGCDEDFGHIYTTTGGFEALFEEAFRLAGGTPVAEPPLPPGVARVHTDVSATEPTLSEAPVPRTAQSCAASPGAPGSRSGACVGIALVAAGIAARRASRGRAKRD